MKRVKFFLIGLLFAILVPLVNIVATMKINYYKSNGIEVEAEVVSVHKIFKASNVTVVYIAEDGDEITAEAITNTMNPYVGMQFTGMVLPEKPNKIMGMPSKSTTIIFNCISLVFFLGGVIIMGAVIYDIIKNKRLDRYGISTEAEVVSYEVDDGEYYVNLIFRDIYGKDNEIRYTYGKSKPNIGIRYTINYLPEKPKVYRIPELD